MPYDVLQLEDEKSLLEIFRDDFGDNKNPDKWRLIQTWALDSFIWEIRANPTLSLFLVDWKFPHSIWFAPEFLLPKALRAIKEIIQENTRIVVYSWEDMKKLEGAIPDWMINRVTIISKSNSLVWTDDIIKELFKK